MSVVRRKTLFSEVSPLYSLSYCDSSVHYEQLDAVDLIAVAQDLEFVKRYPFRERIFGKFLLSLDSC